MNDKNKMKRVSASLDRVMEKARAATNETMRAKRQYEKGATGVRLNGYDPNRPLNSRPK